MKKEISRGEAIEKIKEFFGRDDFSADEFRKMKRLAMKFRIRLREERKKFCKKCFSKLRGKTRVTRFYKIVECENCGQMNRFKH